jgi:hypothetical protein
MTVAMMHRRGCPRVDVRHGPLTWRLPQPLAHGPQWCSAGDWDIPQRLRGRTGGLGGRQRGVLARSWHAATRGLALRLMDAGPFGR